MSHDREILDRKVGRNAQLFARAIARLDTARARFPYLRILVCLVEKAHPEWSHSGRKCRQVARLAKRLSGGALCEEEVADVAAVREEERHSTKRNGQRSATGNAPRRAPQRA